MRLDLTTRTFTLLFSLLFFVSLAACGDDNSEMADEGPLIGSWKWMINERTNCGQDNGSFNVYDCSEFCYEVEFKSGGILTVTVQDETGIFIGDGTYTQIDDAFTLCVKESDGSEFCEIGTITIAADRFEFSIPKPTEGVCDVIKHFERK